MMEYHVPVMLEECLKGLDIKPEGIYVDLTFGGGGHSRAIAERLKSGHLYAFDQDDESESNAKEFDNRSFTFIRANFRYLKKYLKVHGITEVDGILGDLGISSHQIDEGYRGFSTRSDGPLDMRMNRDTGVSAGQLISEIEERELRNMLRKLGDLKNAHTVARVICQARANEPITTTQQLVQVVESLAPRGRRNKFLAQVFQALRMAVNEELQVLEEVLAQGIEILKKDGRFVVLTYHSLEDRLVKNFFSKGKPEGELDKDLYGNLLRPLEPVNRKPIVAVEGEITKNNRARSAKLRIARKV